MKISTRARYALRLMLDICSHSKEGKPVHLQEIANRNNLSKGYLEQLVLALKNAQLLKSTSGRNGGYQLIRAPERISLLDVVEAVIGPINLVECVGYPEECLRSDGCECRVLWELINCRITAVLGDYTLKDLSTRDGITRMTQALERCSAREASPETQPARS